jgi:hypothetical protein
VDVRVVVDIHTGAMRRNREYATGLWNKMRERKRDQLGREMDDGGQSHGMSE